MTISNNDSIPLQSATSRPEFKWDRLSLASSLGYCLLVAALMVGAVLGELREQFQISGVVSALHGSMFGIGLIVVGLFGVRVVHRIGRRSMLITSTVTMLGGVLLLCIGNAWQVTLVGTGLSGFGAAIFVLIMPGLINDHHGPNRAVAFAAVNGVAGVSGLAFNIVIGLALTAGFSWRGPYLALAAVIVVPLAFVAWPVRVPEPTDASKFSLRVFQDRRVIVPWLFMVNAILAEFSMGMWSTTYLKEVGGASSGAAPILAGAFALPMLLIRLRLASARRWFGEWLGIACLVTLALGAIMMYVGPSLWIRVLGLAVAGLGSGPMYPLAVDELYKHAEGHLDSVALGAVCALGSGVSVTFGPILLGLLADRVGLRSAILFVSFLCALAIITQRPNSGIRTRLLLR